MYDYPHFDGTQACLDSSPQASLAFSGTIGADPSPALALCAICPFTTECRNWAVTHDVYGIWGATTDEDRAAVRARGAMPEPSSITEQLDDMVLALRATTGARAVPDEPTLSRAS